MALVGFRKVMDFFPSVFSQKELFWLDNLMPESKKKDKKKEKKNKSEKGTNEVKIGYLIFFLYFDNHVGAPKAHKWKHH